MNFGAVIVDLAGEPVDDGGKPATLGAVAVKALLANYPDEKGIDGKEKVRRFTLSAVCFNEAEADVSVEDVALLKGLIAKAYGPLVVGRAFAIIECPVEAAAG